MRDRSVLISRGVKLALLVAAASTLAAPASAQPNRTPVQVEVRGLFGDDVTPPQGWAPMLVTLENRTTRDLSGELHFRVRDWQNRGPEHVVPVDLPARATRRLQFTVKVRDGGDAQVQLLDGRTELGAGSVGIGYNASARGIVILSDPPRLRGRLLDLQDEQHEPYGGTRMVNLPVGVVSFDPDTADPLVPREAIAWTGIELVVASAPALERLDAAQRDALLDWIRTGGAMLVFPRTEQDVQAPILGSILGPVEWVDGYAYTSIPERAMGRVITSPPGSRVEQEHFGVSAALGFGRVYVAAFDGALEESFVEHDATRRAVDTVLNARIDMPGQDSPFYRFGSREMSSEPWNNNGSDFSTLRPALDPNESFRPALGLVAVVLLLYVFAVGPINFNYIGKKNRPILALVSTPVIAIGCLLVLLAVGYIGKGTTMRYRSISLLEAMEGERSGPERRYTGFFLTRPATFDLELPERGNAELLDEGGAQPPTITYDGDRPMLEGLQGGLWETLFVRREMISELGGSGITFERTDNHLSAVRNESALDLRDAFVVDNAGNVYAVGDVASGQTANIPGTPAHTFGTDVQMFWGRSDSDARALARQFGLDPREDADMIYGLVQTMGGGIKTPMPTLYARFDADPVMEAERFVPEEDLRFVRIVPRAARVQAAWYGGGPDDNPGSFDPLASPDAQNLGALGEEGSLFDPTDTVPEADLDAMGGGGIPGAPAPAQSPYGQLEGGAP